MATAEKNSSRSSEERENTIPETGLLKEVERTGSALAGEIKQLFDILTDKVNGLAGAAADATATVADATVSVAEKVRNEPGELLISLLNEVKAVGEASVKSISDNFDALRTHVLSSSEKKPTKKKKGKKRAKKKAAGKPATRKKTTPRKKVAPKKKTVARKKSTPRKKTTTKKKSAARKKAVTKKTITKKKVASGKKRATKKKV